MKDVQLRLARFLAKDFESAVESGRHVLLTLSQLDEVKGLDPRACTSLFADQLAHYAGFTGFSLAISRGNVIASAPPVSGPQNFSDRGWFQELLQTREFTVSEYLIGRISGKSTLILSQPVIGTEGDLKGVLALGLGLDWLASVTSGAPLPQGSTLTAVDRNGTILFCSPDNQAWVGKSLPESPLVM